MRSYHMHMIEMSTICDVVPRKQPLFVMDDQFEQLYFCRLEFALQLLLPNDISVAYLTILELMQITKLILSAISLEFPPLI